MNTYNRLGLESWRSIGSLASGIVRTASEHRQFRSPAANRARVRAAIVSAPPRSEIFVQMELPFAPSAPRRRSEGSWMSNA